MNNIKNYRGNSKAFVCCLCCELDRERVDGLLLQISELSPLCLCTSNNHANRSAAARAGALIAFLSPDALADKYDFLPLLDAALAAGTPILCVYLRPARLSPRLTMLLDSYQSSSCTNDDEIKAFLKKLPDSKPMAELSRTKGQKRSANRTLGIFAMGAALAVFLFMFSAGVFGGENAWKTVPEDPFGQEEGEVDLFELAGLDGLTEEDLLGIEELYIYGDVREDYCYTAYTWSYSRKGAQITANNEVKQWNGEAVGRSITVDEGHIRTIDDIAKLKNLKRLVIMYNQITDISPILGLTELEYLDLSCNPISDISGIGKLTSLNYLFLKCCRLTDISPLRDFPAWQVFEYIDMSKNRISDLSPMYHMGVRNIYMYNNLVTNVSGIEKMSRTESIILCGCPLADTTPVYRMPNLHGLDLGGTKMFGIENLREFRSGGLAWIMITSDQTRDFSPLFEDNVVSPEDNWLILDTSGARFDFTTLRPAAERGLVFGMLGFDSAGQNCIESLDGQKIEHLKMGRCSIFDLEPLSRAEYIIKLQLNNCDNIRDLSPLVGCAGLECLVLEGCDGITDLEPLLECPQLREVTVSNDLAESAAAIAGMATFEILYS